MLTQSIQFIPTINNQLELMKTSIDVLIKQNNDYLNSLKRYSEKQFEIEIEQEETEEEKKKRLETMLDQIDDIKIRSGTTLKEVVQFIEKIQKLQQETNTLQNYYQTNYQTYEKKVKEINAAIIKEIRKMRQSEIDKMKKKQEEEMTQLKQKFDQMLNEYKPMEIIEIDDENNDIEIIETNENNDDSMISDDNVEIKNKLLNDMMEIEIPILTAKEMKQLEEWTELKFCEVVFDSDVNNWSPQTSVFDDKIVGTKQLLFIIEDMVNNVFGYYLSTEIKEVYEFDVATDFNTFLFSLRSNNRLPNPMKFEMNNITVGYKLFDKHHQCLIQFGKETIVLSKNNTFNVSIINQKNDIFDYHGYENALIGKTNTFIPKRFIVIQMI